jgi:hypothetical protein
MFHADEAQVHAAGRVPVVALLVGPGYLELVHEIAGLPAGTRVGMVGASERGVDSMQETLRIAGATGIDLQTAWSDRPDAMDRIDADADIILMSRDALASGLDRRFARPERIRPWTYEFDPAGLEHFRRAVEQVAARRATSGA